MSSASTERSQAPFYITLGGLFVVGTIFAVAKRENPLVLGWEGIGILVSTGLTLALYSFLYGDTPLFKAAEHLYVGVGLGYQIVEAWNQYIKPEAYKQLLKYAVRDNVPGKPEWALVPALVLSAMLLIRFIPKLSWAARVTVAFIVGFTAATQATSYVDANLLKQVEFTVLPLTLEGGIGVLIGRVVILVGVLATLLYFFFSIEQRGPVRFGTRVGTLFLMVSFGASYGYTVMGRMALLVDRLQFLIGDWLRIPLK